MIVNKNLQVEAEQKNQQSFTIIKKVIFFYVVNATNEDEALQKFDNLELDPSEYYRFASETQIAEVGVIDNDDFVEAESKCIIKNVNSFRESKRRKMKILSYEEFYNHPRLYQCSDDEIKSDYKKLETQQQFISLRKRYNFYFKKKKFDVANSIKEQMNKLIGIKE